MSAATLSTSVVAASPGRDAGCDVHLRNPSGDPLALRVEVDGPAGEWAVVLPRAVVLAPGGSGRARLTFTVPECERLAGSTHPFAVRVTGGTPVELTGRVEIAEVHDLRVSIRPLVARGRRASTHTVTVENRGTRPSEAVLAARDAAGTLDLRLVDGRVSVAPGEHATVGLRVAPRQRSLAGRPEPHPFSVEARPQAGPPVTAGAVRFQDPVRWRRGVVAAAAALAVAPVGAWALRRTPAPDAGPLAGAVAAQASPLALAPACPATGAAGDGGLAIAGFTFCPAAVTVAAGAEVTWTNADMAAHTVTYDGPDGPVDSGSLGQGQSWSARFDRAGTYRYYCRFHPGMSGTIVVQSVR